MSMTGYIPTDEDIAEVVKNLQETDPENANTAYAREMLIRMKLMYREIGRIDEKLLHKELEEFKRNMNISYNSYQLANAKWVPNVIKREYLPDEVKEQAFTWDELFDTKKEADDFARSKIEDTPKYQ